MRVLFATDGSTHARVAQELIRGLAWPEGSTIRVVTTMTMGMESLGLSWATGTADTVQHQGDDARRYHEDIIENAVRDLTRPSITIERLLLHGRPASSIVEEARAWPADLVIVGHRGRGSIASMILGSVSAEVVDHAPCPVLVVRRPTAGSLVLATDGSPSARHAEDVLATWPMFGGTSIRVVSVAPTGAPWAFGMAMDSSPQVLDAMAEDVRQARLEHEPLVNEAADRLIAAGRSASAEVLDGQPAAAIVATLEAHDDDLVVIGSRGHTGVARLLLGSVARNVLVHAPSSVLVVREHARIAGLPEPALAVELS